MWIKIPRNEYEKLILNQIRNVSEKDFQDQIATLNRIEINVDNITDVRKIRAMTKKQFKEMIQICDTSYIYHDLNAIPYGEWDNNCGVFNSKSGYPAKNKNEMREIKKKYAK